MDLCGDRLSDHRFLANSFRLYLHAASLNLLVLLRNHCGASPQPEETSPRNVPPVNREDMDRSQPATWRRYLIKLTAEVIVSSRRVLVRLSGCWPHLD